MLILTFKLDMVEKIKSGAKTQTRRVWSERTIKMFIRAYVKCQLVQAYAGNPRNGGTRFGYLRILDLDRLSLFDITRQDVIAEGFPDMTNEAFIAMFCKMHKGLGVQDTIQYVRFEFIPEVSDEETKG